MSSASERVLELAGLSWDRTLDAPLIRAMAHGDVADDVLARYFARERSFVGTAARLRAAAVLRAPTPDAARGHYKALGSLLGEQDETLDVAAMMATDVPASSAETPLALRVREVAERGSYPEILCCLLATESLYAHWCRDADLDRPRQPALERWISLHTESPFVDELVFVRSEFDALEPEEPLLHDLAALAAEILDLERSFHEIGDSSEAPTPAVGVAAEAGPVELAASLVRIASDTTTGEAQVASFIAERLRVAGIAVEVIDAGGRTNVVARIGTGARPICLSGHLDTVPVTAGEWHFDPFGGECHAGRLRGRGASDMKGGVAAAVCAMESWGRRPERQRPDVLMVLSGGEELGCLGASGLVRRLEPASAILVLEPTCGQPRLGHRGALWLELAIPGVAAHASTPQLGVSAIRRAAELALQIEQMTCEIDDLLGPVSLSVGQIRGGSAPNIVPDHCKLTVDIRLNGRRTAMEWRELIGQSAPEGTKIDVLLDLSPVESRDAGSTLAGLAAGLDVGLPSGAVPFFTDASVLSGALDAPVLICGPGDPATIHGPDEACEIAALVEFTERLTRLPVDWRDGPLSTGQP